MKAQKSIILFILFSNLLINSGFARSLQLQAAYIQKFTDLIQWPDDYNADTITIGIFSITHPLARELRCIKANKVLIVRQFRRVEDITKCHILFIPDYKIYSFVDVLTKIGYSSTVLITESEGYAVKGATINFVEQDCKLLFELNHLSITRRHLCFSESLYAAAIPMKVSPNDTVEIWDYHAAFIKIVAEHIKWQRDENPENFVIGVLGLNHPLTLELLKIAALYTTTDGKFYQIVEFGRVEKITNCQILFIPNEQCSNIHSISDKIINQNTLMIANSCCFSNDLIINTFVINSHYRYGVDKTQAEKQQMLLSETFEKNAIVLK